MEEKERRQEGQQQRRRRKKRNGKKRLRRERERQKRKRMALLLAEAGIVLALAILLAVFLLRGCGTQPEAAAAVAQGAGLQNLERLQEVTAEILAAEAEPSEEERVSTVKEVATETDEVTVGIDVSEYQGNIDWSQGAEGIDYVMVRVGYRSSETGEITEDACARYNLQEARDQGLYLGAYFFSTAVSEEEAREEARWVCELLKGYPITYPVAYNCEGFQSFPCRASCTPSPCVSAETRWTRPFCAMSSASTTCLSASPRPRRSRSRSLRLFPSIPSSKSRSRDAIW